MSSRDSPSWAQKLFIFIVILALVWALVIKPLIEWVKQTFFLLSFIAVIIIVLLLIGVYLYYRLKKAGENHRRKERPWHEEEKKGHGQEYERPRYDKPKTDYEAACKILGVTYDETRDACRKKWHNWQKIYHRDAMVDSDSDVKRQAEEELKKINAAWDIIKKYHGWS